MNRCRPGGNMLTKNTRTSMSRRVPPRLFWLRSADMLYEMTDHIIMRSCGVSVKRAIGETAVAVTQGNASEREEGSRQT